MLLYFMWTFINIFLFETRFHIQFQQLRQNQKKNLDVCSLHIKISYSFRINEGLKQIDKDIIIIAANRTNRKYFYMQKSLIIAKPQENSIHPLLPQFQCCPHQHCKILVSIIIELNSKVSSKIQLHDIPCQCANTKLIQHFEKNFSINTMEDSTKPFENQLIQMRKSYEIIWKEVQILSNENCRLLEQNQKLSKQRQQINNKLAKQQGQVRRVSTKLKENYQGKIQKLLNNLSAKNKVTEQWSSLDLTSYDQSIIRNSKFINSQQEELLKYEFLNSNCQLKATTAHFIQLTGDIQTKRKQRKSSKFNILMNSSSENQISIPQKNHEILLNQIQKRDHQIISLKSACQGLKQQLDKLKSFIIRRQSIQNVRSPAIMHLRDILYDLDL